jgi:inhibitor of KinA sporulation pathway (predicted exonuclease)
MAKRLDQVLVIDVESTCWAGAPPDGQISEIIEIGLCTIDADRLERLEKRSFLVQPVKSEISSFCTELTTLTAEQFTGAGSFADAARVLKKSYHAKDRLWASWGDYDRRQFERMCLEFEVGNPFGPGHLNVKTLFAIATGSHHELGLEGACKKLGMDMTGTHHRGHDDAWNIAGVLCWLLSRIRDKSS